MEACDPLEHVNVYRRLPQQGTYLYGKTSLWLATWRIAVFRFDCRSLLNGPAERHILVNEINKYRSGVF